jgi:radical SAM superfamily enzyme YgiQ (UPF0313 family)
MKTGLISPSRSNFRTYYSSNSRMRRFFAENKFVPGFFHPNLALLTLAALTPEDIDIKIIDERVEDVNFEEGFDVVGITMMTAQALRGYEIADEFRRRGVHVVLGGIHATVMPEEARNHCDTLIAGEAENTWRQFLKEFRNGSPREVYQEQSVDLRRSPVPRYDLVDTSIFHLLPVQTTRGCPHDCSFCSVTTVFGPKCRTKGVGQIVREIEAIRSVAGMRRCVFNDDNMFVDRKKACEILEAITPTGVKYFAQTDISIGEDDRFLQLLQVSGCKTVFIGFESLVPENLAELQKSRWKLKRLKEYSESCRKIQSFGIQVLGSFVVGFDHDTRDSLLHMRDFVLENHIWAQFLFLTPFPGTRIRNELTRGGRLHPSDSNWDLYTCFDAIFAPKSVSMRELEDTVLEVYEAVYSEEAHRARMRHMVEQMKGAAKG